MTDFKDGGRGKHVGSPVIVSKCEFIVLQMCLFLNMFKRKDKHGVHMLCTCCAISLVICNSIWKSEYKFSRHGYVSRCGQICNM